MTKKRRPAATEPPGQLPDAQRSDHPAHRSGADEAANWAGARLGAHAAARLRPVDEAPHLVSAFRQLGQAGRVELVRRLLGRALTRMGLAHDDFDRLVVRCIADAASPSTSTENKALADLVRLCIRAIEASLPLAPEHFQPIADAYARTDRDLHLGRSRREAVETFSAKGAAARSRYSEADKEQWRTLYSQDYQTHSKTRAAALITTRQGLPDAARASIRAALSAQKKAAKPL